jgi:hypothetical protein
MLPVALEHLGVMPGGHRVETKSRRTFEQEVELDVSIAFNAGIGRTPRGVARHEGRHHVSFELFGVVKDVVVDAEHLRDTSSVVDVRH